MSVRRLAPEAFQPARFAFSDTNQRWAEATIARYPAGRQASAVIPLLMRAQEQEGWVSRPAIERVADMLGMAYIRVLEVATFYTQFQLRPVGSLAHIQVCGTTPCLLRGAEDIRALCQHRINHEPFETNPEGTLSWEEVECLGACVNAPMVMIGKDTYEDLTVERFEEIVSAFAAGRGGDITPGTQIERQFSAAPGGATTLLEEPTASRTRIESPPPAPAPAPANPAPASPPPAAAPVNAGKPREVEEEGAPALKEPKGAPKVSLEKAEAAREKAHAEAKATGAPNIAMREGATGAESPAGKTDAGKAAGKATRPPAGEGASAAGTAPLPPAEGQKPRAAGRLKPTREKGGDGGKPR